MDRTRLSSDILCSKHQDTHQTCRQDVVIARQPNFSHGFFPYVDNGGTVLAIAQADFAICVADTRLSTGYRIHSRQHQKFTPLTSTCLIASSGMQADIHTLHKLLTYRVKLYEFQHHKTPTLEALAQLLSTLLYSRRFFPFYAFNALIGLDKNGIRGLVPRPTHPSSSGQGAIYDYDSIGSFQRSPYTARGSGTQLAMSILDNQIRKDNQSMSLATLDQQQLLALAKDVMVSVAERDIYTGDFADVILIDRLGLHSSSIQLKKH